MATQEFRFDPGQILQPAYPDALNRLAPTGPWGASLTLAKGSSVGRKASDGKFYAFNNANSDGTQIWAGFVQQSMTTDASGNVFFTFGGTAGAAGFYTPTTTYAGVYTSGIFDPTDVSTAPTPVAEQDTFTPGGTITTGDVNKLAYTAPNGTVTNITFTTGATTTAAAVSAGLIAAWNANATTAAIATATGTATAILTAVVAGTPFTVASSVTGVGTLTRVATTAASGRVLADVQTGSPGARVLQQTGFWRIP